MSVGTFVQPDHETQNGTPYKTNIDNCIAVVGQIAGQFAPHEAATPNMTIKVDAGRMLVDGNLVVRSQQTTATIVKPTTNPRIDRVVIDAASGAVSVVTGTEAASPSAPAIPSGKLPICQIALTTSTSAITNSLITDERVGSGGATSSESASVPIGIVEDFAGGTPPNGWLLCYGQAISRTTYAALFAAIGTTWGAGNGSTTFNVPDLRGRTTAGKDNMGGSAAGRITVFNAQAVGKVGGLQTHVLSQDEMPAHNHDLVNGTLVLRNTYGNYSLLGGENYNLTPNTITVENEGGGAAHNNMQPTAIMNKIIYTGVYT